jgi:hypothetical protein
MTSKKISISPDEAKSIAEEVYIYGYPLVTMEYTKRVMTNVETPGREQVHALSAIDYFKLLAQLLKTNPPAVDDSAIVSKMARLGIVPGEEFDVSRLDTAVVTAINEVAKPAQEKILASLPEFGKVENGWSFIPETGKYSTNYLFRAMVTAIGLGAQPPAGCHLSSCHEGFCR